MSDQNSSQETYQFQAEINQLMSLIINAFYSNKEIFLRELISNSSDALDKIKFEGIQNKEALDKEPNLNIKINIDKENNKLIIEDTGIGMTKDDLIKCLGTIANSGTKKFIQTLTAEKQKDLSMIGQFGVGFYSSYLVANNVKVITKHNNDIEYIWESDSNGTYTITKSENPELIRGTKIVLTIKEEDKEYLDVDRIKDVIKKHSEYIQYPIMVNTEKTKEEEVDEEKITKTYYEYDQINTQEPIWSRPQSEITEEEYIAFYKALTNDFGDPMKFKHFSVEGAVNFKSIIYIPGHPPMNLFHMDRERMDVKLYVKKVLISENCDKLIPQWLNFIKGIVDSDDIPLNVSREMLQQNKFMKLIKKSLTKKTIELLEEIQEDKDEYMRFYLSFGKNIKLGIHEDSQYENKLIELLRYKTTKSSNKFISLKEYVNGVKEKFGEEDKYKTIYYIIGEDMNAIEKSPLIEGFKKKDIEVLLMTDAIDEYMMKRLTQYHDYKFVNVCNSDVDLSIYGEESKEEENKEELIEYLKKVLDNKVSKIVISKRLLDAPCVLSTDTLGWSANMERIMKAQALGDTQMKSFMTSSKTLEINIEHPIIKGIDKAIKDKKLNGIDDTIFLLYNCALLSSGFSLDEPQEFIRMVNGIIGDRFKENEENVSEVKCEDCEGCEGCVEDVEIVIE